MQQKIFTLLFLLSTFFTASSQTTLSGGDMAVVGINITTNKIKFVTFKSIDVNTVIYLTDYGWESFSASFHPTSITTGTEGLYKWTVGTNIPAGTIFEMTFSTSGTISYTLFNLTSNTNITSSVTALKVGSGGDVFISTGENFFIYQGGSNDATYGIPIVNPKFICGFNNCVTTNGTANIDATGWSNPFSSGFAITSSIPTVNSNFLNGGLINGVNAIGMVAPKRVANVWYTGPTTATDALTWATRLNDVSNWSGDGTGTITTTLSSPIVVYTSSTWNGSVWSTVTPNKSVDAIIASTTTSGGFACNKLIINSSVGLTLGINDTIKVNNDILNNGNGILGNGVLTIAASSNLSGNALTINGTLNLSAGTFNTGGLLTISPGGKITGSYTNVTGTVTLQQSVVGQRAFRLFANPFSTTQAYSSIATANGITINTTPNATTGLSDIRLFSNSTNAWSNGGTSTVANTPYSLFIRGLASEVTGSSYTGGPSAFTYNVTGTLNGNSVSVTPSSTANFMLSGNPFAAPVNSKALTGGVALPYYTYQVAVTGTPRVKTGSWVAAGSNSNASNTIPVLGVVAYQPSSTSTFTVTTADINTSGTLQTGLFGTNDAVKQLELVVTKNGDFEDKLFVRLDANATSKGSDMVDLQKITNDNTNVYTIATDDNKRLAVDARSNLNGIIPIGITGPNGNYSLQVATNTLAKETSVLLKDKWLNTETPLLAGATYSFSITTDALSKGDSRFELQTTTKVVTQPVDNNATGLSVKVLGLVTNSNTIKLAIAGAASTVTVAVKDITGKIISITSSNNGTQTIPTGATKGMIIVQVTDGTCTITEKVFNN